MRYVWAKSIVISAVSLISANAGAQHVLPADGASPLEEAIDGSGKDPTAADAAGDGQEFFYNDDYTIELSVDDIAEDAGLQDWLGVQVTVASRSEEAALAAPSTVTVFTRDEIRIHGITTLEELLNHVPGFQATRDNQRGNTVRTSIRGRGSAQGEYILVLVDGQRLNDVYSGGPSLINRHISLEHVHQVEIIRGPGSALYGSNALLGVINIVTTTDSKSIAARAGNADTREAAVNVFYDTRGDEDGGLTASLSASIFSDSGEQYDAITDRTGNTGATEDPRSGMDAYATISYGDVLLRLRHTERRLGGFLPAGYLQRQSSIEEVKQSSVHLVYARQLSPRVKVNAAGHYSTEQWSLMAAIPPGSSLVPGVENEQYWQAGAFHEWSTAGLQAGAELRLATNNRLHFNVTYDQNFIHTHEELFSYHLQTNEPVSEDGLPATQELLAYNGSTRRLIVGADLQDRQTIADVLDLSAGVRLDVYDDIGISLNPRLAAVYQSPISSIAKVIYGRAFRAPNFLELYDITPVTHGNDDLEAETIDTIEAAYTQKLGAASVTATYFYNSLDNKIELGPPAMTADNPFGAPTHRNLDERESSQGIEVEVAANPFAGFRLRGAYTRLIDNVDNNGTMPTQFATAMASLRIRGLSVATDVVVRGKTPALSNQDAYVLLGGRLAYAVFKQLRVTLSVRNALDTSYLTISDLMPEGLENRGRFIRVGIEAEY